MKPPSREQTQARAEELVAAGFKCLLCGQLIAPGSAWGVKTFPPIESKKLPGGGLVYSEIHCARCVARGPS